MIQYQTTHNVKGLSRRAIIRAFFEASRPMGMGGLQDVANRGAPLSDERIDMFIEEFSDGWKVDYVIGRPLKLICRNDVLDVRLFDRDHGTGAGATIMKEKFDR